MVDVGVRLGVEGVPPADDGVTLGSRKVAVSVLVVDGAVSAVDVGVSDDSNCITAFNFWRLDLQKEQV